MVQLAVFTFAVGLIAGLGLGFSLAKITEISR